MSPFSSGGQLRQDIALRPRFPETTLGRGYLLHAVLCRPCHSVRRLEALETFYQDPVSVGDFRSFSVRKYRSLILISLVPCRPSRK